MRNVLILNGNPKQQSLCHTISNTYQSGLTPVHNIRRLDLESMAFDPDLSGGYDSSKTLEPSLLEFQKMLLWADHITIVSPIWWGGIPAKLKGLMDRSLLPGFAFKYESGNPNVIPLLEGKTSQLILTMDAPEEYDQMQAAPVLAQLNQFTLQFCGIECFEPVFLCSASFVANDKIVDWQTKMRELASQMV
ncbi:NAD(P)H-dependent oxidoreductase [Vibrio coralliilyticus]|uniref:NAD(P)H-dependent oxidoreductase n=1 Tax=Vibrio coralliilyticus TaxID=190893 RepID=UPI000C1676C5|nr:NAD(P)H-dependent oxidoreductase [Vibrio coralliilyticus]